MAKKRSKASLNQDIEPQNFRPSEFMRARRPELFSDSKVIGEPRLSPEVFEYHLDTLTSRKQETEFEHFCRRLAEKEICPNLLPQTGPTGGGDSKVDAETYPVSDAVSLRWYEGIGREAARERWAFAFSAKKTWRSKVQSDVKGVVSTGREYKIIYFITNQFVPDKARAQVEDQLGEKYRVGVRILDRTWIVRCVFGNRRLQLAIESLGLTGYDEASRRVTGPRDLKREEDLKQLEAQIDDPARYAGVEYQLGEDCLRAALLARGLELPRAEVEGRFLRAERIAERVGETRQRLRTVYNRAWTAFWWYDDFTELNRLYDQAEQLVVGSSQATDFERLANLWTLIRATVDRGQMDASTVKLDIRTKTLKSELDRLAADDTRLNNSLLARTDRLLMELPHAADDAELLDSILQELQDIMIATEGLIAYPVEPVARIIRELGDVLPDSERYDELFEITLSMMERRASAGEAGRALLERGYQKLERGKTYDAIRVLGRAQQKLAMREYREELISALFACGSGYEAAGLLWAARANVLAAANQAFAEYWEQGELTPQALACLRKLVWLELQLGRIPSVLAWIEMASAVALQILQTEERRKAFSSELAAWDRTLAILFLRTDFWELKWLGFLPDILDGLELDISWLSLLYALGHEGHLRSEGAIPEAETSDTARDFFRQVVSHPEAKDLPKRPELLAGRTVTLRSFVLGCEVEIEASNNRDSIFLSETMLAALEALMSTSLDGTMAFPHASQFKISVVASDFVDGMPEYKVDETGLGQSMTIKHSTNISRQVSETRGEFQAWLQRLVIEVAFRFTVVDDLDSYLKQLVGDELGLGRAFNFAEMAISVGNILGEKPKLQLADWEADVKGKRFPLERDASWDQGLEQKDETDREEPTLLQPGEGDAPEWLFEVDKLKHRDRQVLSLINIPLWDKAKWQSALYITPPGYPPYLALGFRNAEAGQSIFRGWRSKIGMIDQHEQLRVSIITGIDKRHPANYRLVIGSNINSPQRDPKTNHFLMVYRMHTLEPSDTKNLDNFLKRYNRVGKYILLPAHVIDEDTMPTPFWDLMIGKQELRVCPAWQLGEHDPDVCAIREGEDPIIPEGVEDAPVLKALKRFSKRAGRKNRQAGLRPEIDNIIKLYSEELGTSDPEVISTFFEYLSKGELRGHWPCYCRSGKRLRQCHMGQLLNARTRISTDDARNVLAQLAPRS